MFVRTLIEYQQLKTHKTRSGLPGANSLKMRRRQGKATVSREIQRNGGQGCYRASQADQANWDRGRRPKTCKLVEKRKLANIVVGQLQLQWSPQQIAGWLKQVYADPDGHP